MVVTTQNLETEKEEITLGVVLLNWHVLGDLCDLRLSDWAQDENSKGSYLLSDVDDTPLASIFEGLNFFWPNGTYAEEPFDKNIYGDYI